MTIKTYRDITCDGCQCGSTFSRDEDPGEYMKRYGWVTKSGLHYCRPCQAKGKETEQMELKSAQKDAVVSK